MKKRLTILLILFALLAFSAACETGEPLETGEPASPAAEAAASDAPVSDAPGDTASDETAEATAEPSAELPDEVQVDWQSIYTAFLDENYESITELCYGGIAGVGFIDLDLDSVPELVLFDSGASASMGVQFFDIVDESGAVECVSANLPELGEAFGGDSYSELYVNANYFDDFRLVTDQNGERFFQVFSGNGAVDFSYTELIVFSGEEAEGVPGKILSLSSELYLYEDYDTETGETTASRCEHLGEEISRSEYDALLSERTDSCEDTGYSAFGVFIWSDKLYTSDRDGLAAMTADAVDGYVETPEE